MRIVKRLVLVVAISGAAWAQTPVLEQGTLTTTGNKPFHLQATVTDRDNDEVGKVEMFWVAPDKWRRVISSNEFSQTLVVDGDKTFEQDTGDYFPPVLRTLVQAIVDPQPLLLSWEPGGRAITKANGLADERGVTCFDAQRRMCMLGQTGLSEEIEVANRKVHFTKYEKFEGKRIARQVSASLGFGEGLHASITKLEVLRNPDDSLFAIEQPTPKDKQLRVEFVQPQTLVNIAVKIDNVIWPQVLDGYTEGVLPLYLVVDRSGNVREVMPLSMNFERSNDSARRQILRWKFKPALKNGVPVQVEAIFPLQVNTRAWGPKEPLNADETRKMATNIVEPVFKGVPAGTQFKLSLAVDSDGFVIEKIEGEGPAGHFAEIDKALQQWHFSPVMENGEPRPWRGQLVFVAK